MKKSIKLNVILVLVYTLLGVLLCACGKQQQPETGEADTAEVVKEMPADGSSSEASDDEASPEVSNGDSGGGAQEDEKVQSAAEPELKVEDLVGEQFTFEGERGSEEIGYKMDVIYIVPEILSDSSAAKAINDDIRTYCLDVIEPTQDEMDFPTWYNVGYEANLNGDILSILITKNCTMDDAMSLATFNYHVIDESVVDNVALLQSCGYTEEDFVTQIRKAAAYEADVNMQYMFAAAYWSDEDVSETDRQLMYADYLMYRQNSIAADRVNVNVPMYLDGDGELRALADIDIPAGAGSYQAHLTPRKESKAKDFELSFEDSMFITYKDGVMKIRIEKGDWTEATFGGAGNYLEFGKEYTVEGIYKDYVEGEMLFVCGGEYAVPVFVSDDGMVSALNLYQCAPAGYFCMTEPVMGLKEIEAITEVNGDEIAEEVGNTLINQCGGFARKVLGIYGQQGFNKTYSISGEEGLDTYGYYIGFDEQEEGKFLYQADEIGHANYLCYSGECVVIGMNEEGVILSTKVYADFDEPYDPDPHYSAFSLKRYSEWNDLMGDLEEWAEFKELSGFITLGGVGALMTLDVTYG